MLYYIPLEIFTCLYYNNSSVNIFFLHSGAISFDGLNSDLGFVREKHKHLVSWVIIVSYQYYKITASRTFFTVNRFFLISYSANKLLQFPIIFLDSHDITECTHKIDKPQTIRLGTFHLLKDDLANVDNSFVSYQFKITLVR